MELWEDKAPPPCVSFITIHYVLKAYHNKEQILTKSQFKLPGQLSEPRICNDEVWC